MTSHHVTCHVAAVSRASSLSKRKEKEKENKIPIKSENKRKRKYKLFMFKVSHNTKTTSHPMKRLYTNNEEEYVMLEFIILSKRARDYL